MDVVRDKTIKAITFPRYSVRDYFIICANDCHYLKIHNALHQLLQGTWGEKKMCYLPQEQ